MAILINDNYSLSATKPFDARYMNISTPWASCAEVIAAIPTYRYVGLTVNINGEEYWWKDGIADGNLVPKVLGGASNLSGATNGLQLLCGNTYVGLGGTLTQNTTICGAHTLSLGNATSGLTALCSVTPIFHVEDDGGNSSICFEHNQDTPHFDVCLYGDNANSCAGLILDVDVNEGFFNAYTAPNSTCCSSICLQTTNDNEAILDIHSRIAGMKYCKETWISSSCRMTYEIINDTVSPSQNIKSTMDYSGRCFVFSVDDSPIVSILSGGTARYGSNVTLTNDCDLAHKWYVDNAAGSLSGSNGLCRCGDNITLGGSLTGDTCVTIGTHVLDFYGSNAGFTPSIQLDGTQNSVTINGGGALGVFDNNVVILKPAATGSDCLSMGLSYTEFESTGGTGIRYAGDYENTLVDRSLVTKKYVTSQVSGITGAITTANNGLTKYGQNVVLGGALTGSTSITGGGNKNLSLTGLSGFTVCSVTDLICASTSMCLRSPSITLHNGVDNVITMTSACNIFTDSINSKGFVYAGNYEGNFTARSLVTAQYVTGKTSQLIATANNGLTKSGTNVRLGGTLTGNTCISGAGLYSLCIRNSDATTCTLAEFSPTIIGLCARNINSPNQTGRIAVATSATLMCNGYANCYSCLNMSNSLVNLTFCGGATNAQFIVTDATTDKRGIEYAADYSATFNDNSLITKKYVCSQVSGITVNGVTGATNGLTKYDSNNVCLGGTITSNITLQGNGDSIRQIWFNNLCNFGVNANNTGGTVNSSFSVNRPSCNIAMSVESSLTSSCVWEFIDLNFNRIEFGACTAGTTAKARMCNCGFNYCQDYSSLNTANPRWIPDKGYVDNCVEAGVSGITINAITGATNGLTKVGQDVVLGGTLTGDTTIAGDDNSIYWGCNTSCVNLFSVTASNAFSVDVNGSQAGLGIYSDSVSLYSPTYYISMDENVEKTYYGLQGGQTYLGFSGTNTGNIEMLFEIYSGNTLGARFIDKRTAPAGLEYDDDYSSTYTNRSLVDRQYVCSQVSGITTNAITTANNGLTKIGQNVVLGGSLTGSTCIDGDENLILDTALLQVKSPSEFVGSVCMNTLHVTGSTCLDSILNISGITTFGNTICINSVSSGSVSDEILVWNSTDKCVKRITASGIVPTASNGLCVDGANIVLGGTLTGDTCIDTGTNAYGLLISTDVPQSSGCDANLYVNGNAGGSPYISLQSRNISGCAYSGFMTFSGGTIRVGKTGGAFPGIEYCANYTANFNNCSLVTKQYVDNQVSGISLNTVEVNNVVTNYLATCDDDFIGVSGATEICLPSSPKAGQRLIVSDICGNALANNICIIGNGMCINGSSSATINTDYGAMTFINNGYSWSAVAFIN